MDCMLGVGDRERGKREYCVKLANENFMDPEFRSPSNDIFKEKSKTYMYQKHPWVISFDNASNTKITIVEKKLTVCMLDHRIFVYIF